MAVGDGRAAPSRWRGEADPAFTSACTTARSKCWRCDAGPCECAREASARAGIDAHLCLFARQCLAQVLDACCDYAVAVPCAGTVTLALANGAAKQAHLMSSAAAVPSSRPRGAVWRCLFAAGLCIPRAHLCVTRNVAVAGVLPGGCCNMCHGARPVVVRQSGAESMGDTQCTQPASCMHHRANTGTRRASCQSTTSSRQHPLAPPQGCQSRTHLDGSETTRADALRRARRHRATHSGAIAMAAM